MGYSVTRSTTVSYRSIDGMVKLQGSFLFGDGRELFDTALKYSQPENMWSTKIFEANIFVIHKALLKIMKILSRENLEPCDIH